jgi:hypothetical protein
MTPPVAPPASTPYPPAGPYGSAVAGVSARPVASPYPQPVPYGYPGPYGAWRPPAPAPRIQHSGAGWLVVVLSVLAIVGAGITGIASAVAVAGTGATWHTRADALALPAANAPAATWNAWARRAADDALGKQAKARWTRVPTRC